ncbi:hypothetical protein QYF61_020229 [Mycteria americana]|uniref:Rna-directed dna polymerase from mobile element jockey-like n=1 Tax=Mycteria americana TaxID=33587 RepID=A0AAN7PKS4_MYCAM|nr:hypothetical protein QYF61_020229 [Mycteria americana]
MEMKKKQRHSMFFCSVFNNTDRLWVALSPELEDHECGNSGFPFVETEIVRDQLYQLNIHKSMGPDGIHPRVLKELGDVMAGTLLIIYQRSWESGEVPADWKLPNVIPIYKKGMREDPGNYRPRDIDRLEHWAMVNGMKLNKSTCWILHLGWGNMRPKYKWGEEWLESSPAERDLGGGVLVGSRLNMSQQCALAARRATCILGCIKPTIISWSKEFGENEAEGDLIALHSFLRRGSGQGGADLFSLISSDRMCGNGSKLCQGRFKLDIRKHFFTERVVKHWNRLLRGS